MATFQKLTDVAIAEVVSEQANVFIEDGGELKRVAKSQVGGAGSLADLKDVVYFHMDIYGSGEADAAETENVITCNKEFDEIKSLILNHELKMVTGVIWYENGWNQAQLITMDWYLFNSDNMKVFDSSADNIVFFGMVVGESGRSQEQIYWTMSSDGSITIGQPSGGGPS